MDDAEDESMTRPAQEGPPVSPRVQQKVRSREIRGGRALDDMLQQIMDCLEDRLDGRLDRLERIVHDSSNAAVVAATEATEVSRQVLERLEELEDKIHSAPPASSAMPSAHKSSGSNGPQPPPRKSEFAHSKGFSLHACWQKQQVKSTSEMEPGAALITQISNVQLDSNRGLAAECNKPGFATRGKTSDLLQMCHQVNAEADNTIDSDDEALMKQQQAISSASGFFCNKLILHPNSVKRLSWDLFGMLLIVWDLVMIPLNMGFRPEETPFTRFMLYLTLGFWSCDIIGAFVTGYFDKGVLEMRHKKIALHYLKTWWTMDCFVVGIDWVLLFMSGSGEDEDMSMAKVGRTFRAVRILRSLRLLRLVKLKRIMEEVRDRISSEYVHILLDVLKLILLIVAINHIIACSWFGLGTSRSDGWVDSQKFNAESLDYQYASALHWSLTQFTPASMEVIPHNVQERSFAVAVLLFALIIFSSFVSSITAAMTRMRQLSTESSNNLAQLRRFLRDYNVSQTLGVRIKRYVEYAMQAQAMRIQEKDVKLLQTLSLPLQMELKYEAYAPILKVHPFFQMYAEADSQALRRICYSALLRSSLSKGDSVFTAGTQSDRMFFVVKGRLQYFHVATNALQALTSQTLVSGGDNSMDVDNRRMLEQGQWCCEAALWVSWVHVGTLRARSVCDLVAVDAAKFAQITAQQTVVGYSSARYAQKFAQRISNLALAELTDLPDDVFEVENFVGQHFSGDSTSGPPSKQGATFGHRGSIINRLLHHSGMAPSTNKSVHSKLKTSN